MLGSDLDRFGREVERRAAECRRPVLLADVLLGEAKVRELDVAVVVDQDALGLEVPVDDVQLVQLAERQRQLRQEELRLGDGEGLLVAQVVVELTALDEVDDEVELIRRREGVVKLHEERVVHLPAHTHNQRRLRISAVWTTDRCCTIDL